MSASAPPPSAPAFTVAICTRNRASILERALTALAALVPDSPAHEIVVVDNGSEDDTREVVERFQTGDAPVRYVFEPDLGIAHARNRAYREARGEYLAYTDDDAIVPPDWLTIAQRIKEEHRPAMFGGPFRAYFDTKPPAWFLPSYGSYEPYDASGAVPPGAYLPGANLFVRRDVLEALGGFNRSFGHRGKRIAFGEEPELLERVRARFGTHAVRYDPALWVSHRVDPSKLHVGRFARIRFANGRDYGRRTSTGQESVAWLALRAGWNALRLGTLGLEVVSRDRTRHPDAVPYAIQRALPRVWNLGHVYGTALVRLSRSADPQ